MHGLNVWVGDSVNFLLLVGALGCIWLGTYLAGLKRELEADQGKLAEKISVLLFVVGTTMLGVFLRGLLG